MGERRERERERGSAKGQRRIFVNVVVSVEGYFLQAKILAHMLKTRHRAPARFKRPPYRAHHILSLVSLG